MPSTQSASSGSEADAIKYGLMDEKKRKRMQSNRESAKRSRMKQQKKMEDLVDEKARLLTELKKNSASYSGRERGWHSLESENNLLIAEKMCLAKRLDNFNSLIVNLGLVENNTPKSPELNNVEYIAASTMQLVAASAGRFWLEFSKWPRILISWTSLHDIG